MGFGFHNQLNVMIVSQVLGTFSSLSRLVLMLATINNLELPSNFTNVNSFLGSINYKLIIISRLKTATNCYRVQSYCYPGRKHLGLILPRDVIAESCFLI